MSCHITLGISSLTLLLLSACAPKYPKCENDQHCQEGEFCINGLCQQCRSDQDCGKGQQCKSGRCEAIEGYCETSQDCANQQVCKNNRCTPCETNSDCAENQECKDGRCISPPPPAMESKGPCSPETVYFGFNQSVLTPEATSILQQAAKCISEKPKSKVRLEGHCDPRGTVEYNLALGDARAQSVKRYLSRLGIKKKRFRVVSKGELEAMGNDESGWARDRKVVPIWE